MPMHPFVSACRAGKYSRVVELCENTTIPVPLLNEGLLNACCKNKVKVVKFLLEHGADVHCYDEEAFRSALSRNFTNLAKLVFKWGKENGTPIDIHARNDDAFASVCTKTPERVAEFIRDFMEGEEPGNDMIIAGIAAAVICANRGVIEYLRELPCEEPNKRDTVAFVTACGGGTSLEFVQWIHSLNPDNIDMNHNDDRAFVSACEVNEVEIARWITTVTTVNPDWNDVMYWAIEFGNDDIVRFILTLPIETPIDLAAASKHEFFNPEIYFHKDIHPMYKTTPEYLRAKAAAEAQFENVFG